MYYPIACYVTVTVLTLLEIVTCYLFPDFLGYQIRKNKIPFFAFSAVAFAGVIAVLLLYKASINELIDLTDTVMSVYMLAVFYILYKPIRKLSFFFIALALSSLVDYLAAVATTFYGGFGDLGASIYSAVVYALIILALILLKKAGIRPLPELIEGSPIVYLTVFMVAFNGYYGMFLNIDET